MFRIPKLILDVQNRFGLSILDMFTTYTKEYNSDWLVKLRV